MQTRTLRQLADMICGNGEDTPFVYRSSMFLTEFFEDVGLDYQHRGGTRNAWVKEQLEDILARGTSTVVPGMPDELVRVLTRLMDRTDGVLDDGERSAAMRRLNDALSREGYQVFYGEDSQFYIRHVASSISSPMTSIDPYKSFSPEESRRRQQLALFLDRCSEDELIEQVLLPLFRRLGFQRVSVTGHRDKALEYGKDLWMRLKIPTQQFIYFGIQAKKGKLDARGAPNAQNVNIAEIHQQALMMLGHEIFDADTNRRVLVDHAYIVAGGEITKQARQWLAERLDVVKRSQIMFLEREDLLNLFCVSTDLPIPEERPPF